ncbi:MAG: class I SAM-dependent methyltransferase [Phycisphaeraceae bacterium]|nr:class I SAM-dependent methyltransferase [Phycisphaeraceae bacterium]
MDVEPATNPTTRFSDRAADYVRYRPGYPPEAVDAILDGLGEASSLIAADVGAGTGISARALAARGVRVIAVEPNQAMREAGTSAPGATIQWRDGRAEATGLAAGSVGLVLVAQAFHWFDQPAAIREFHRILRPGGRLVLMWNARDRRDPLTREYCAAIEAIDGEDPAEKRGLDETVIWREGLFEPPSMRACANFHELDGAGLIGRAMSASYSPKRGERHDELVRRLRDVFARHERGGVVRMVYETRVYAAGRVGE